MHLPDGVLSCFLFCYMSHPCFFFYFVYTIPNVLCVCLLVVVSKHVMFCAIVLRFMLSDYLSCLALQKTFHVHMDQASSFHVLCNT